MALAAHAPEPSGGLGRLREIEMSTVEEIVQAVSNLDSAQFVKLRKKLDRLEAQIWQRELAQTTQKMAKAKLTDEDIDRLVLRRRHENRR
jgi:hypothetical protein